MKTIRLSSTALIAALALAGAASAHAANAPKVTQTIKLLRSQNAFKAPRVSSGVVRRVPATTPILGTPYTMPILDTRAVKGHTWVKTRLPNRPNGTRGWMKTDSVQYGSTTWAVGVNLKTRRATVYRSGKVVRRFSVIIGKRSTPTPTGDFFVTEKIAQPAPYSLGPWVLALNGYSNFYMRFAGGPGQIALHGRGALKSAPLGSAASNGCVRFADRETRWLSANLPVGTPVSINRASNRVYIHANAKAARVTRPAMITMAMTFDFALPGTALAIMAG